MTMKTATMPALLLLLTTALCGASAQTVRKCREPLVFMGCALAQRTHTRACWSGKDISGDTIADPARATHPQQAVAGRPKPPDVQGSILRLRRPGQGRLRRRQQPHEALRGASPFGCDACNTPRVTIHASASMSAIYDELMCRVARKLTALVRWTLELGPSVRAHAHHDRHPRAAG